MAKVDSFSFGLIVVNGKKYTRDLFLYADGSVVKRKGGFWKFGSHTIRREEIEKLLKTKPDTLIIGTGTDSKAKLTPDAESFMRESKIESVVLSSPQAIDRFNQEVGQGKHPAALIHITC
jgi:hypothetical protein